MSKLASTMKGLIWAFILISIQQVISQAGPFRMVFNQLALCDEPFGDIKFPTKVSKQSRHIITYTCKPCIIGKTLDDSTSVTLNLAKHGNGGWRPNYLTLHYKRFCSDGWPIFGKTAEHLLGRNSSTKISCPIPAGDYIIDNYPFNFKKYEQIFPVLPHGKFRMDLDFTKKSVRVGCLRLFIDVVPKSVGKG